MQTCKKHHHVICPECAYGPEGPRQSYITDAGKRVSDQINGILTFAQPWEIRTKWMAFKLFDGSSDGTLYDTREDAIRHQLMPELCAYFIFGTCLGGIKPLDAQIFMDVQRHAYDNGMRLHEPEAPQLILDVANYDRMRRRARR